jgi:hypothetical protein
LSTIGWLISACPAGSPGQPQHGEGGVLRGLEHDGAADRQGRGHLLGEQHQRGIPRDHRAHHADRLAQREDHVVAALVRRQRLAGDLVGPAGVVVEDVSHEAGRHGVDLAEAQRDAVVQGLQLHQLVGMLADQVRDRAQHPDPLAGPCVRPGALVERPARRLHGPVDVGRGGDRELGDLLAGGGVHVAPGGLVGRRNPVSVDQHAAVAEAELVAVRLDGCDHARLP